MYQTVRDVARSFLTEFEGYLQQMYLDARGLVTTGVGDLIDPIGAVRQFRWVRIGARLGPRRFADGDAVGYDVVEAEWRRVKALQGRQLNADGLYVGGGNFVDTFMAATDPGTGGPVITLQIATDEIDRKFLPKLEAMESVMKRTTGGYFADYESYPADAQLGVLGLIWANGAGDMEKAGHWPSFCALCRDRKWRAIVDRNEYRWKNIMADRDRAMRRVFANAAEVEDAKAQGLSYNFERVYYPGQAPPAGRAASGGDAGAP